MKYIFAFIVIVCAAAMAAHPAADKPQPGSTEESDMVKDVKNFLKKFMVTKEKLSQDAMKAKKELLQCAKNAREQLLPDAMNAKEQFFQDAMKAEENFLQHFMKAACEEYQKQANEMCPKVNKMLTEAISDDNEEDASQAMIKELNETTMQVCTEPPMCKEEKPAAATEQDSK